MGDAGLVARFAAGVVSVSSVLFFSASIPCILSTSIPLSVGRIVIVWFLRVALSCCWRCRRVTWCKLWQVDRLRPRQLVCKEERSL